MVLDRKRMAVDDFEDFVDLPQNNDKLFEFIGGEIVEVPSNPYSSKISARITVFIGMYLLQNDIGHLTGEAGGYKVSGERYTPDVAVILYDKQKKLARKGYNDNPPDLAVEVMSPSDNDDKLRIKITNYLAAGTIVWVVDPDEEVVEVYELGKPVRIVEKTGTLTVESILPSFKLAVKDIFPPKEDD
ncbi:MAG: Uma2 family endonuclease [Anaerolineae bacterium]|nr:Uma2 family endonuclease [Anaerolineae bacterium]